jgi:hypothetical protein
LEAALKVFDEDECSTFEVDKGILSQII